MTITTTHKDEENWNVPWSHQADWEEMLQFTGNICEELGESRVEVMRHINDIISDYEDLEASLSHLCAATCPACENVCCTKATVWYDQRDIIVYHLATGFFPEKQVSRSVTGACCHLGPGGCRLPRLERPFICTWYICGAQTAMLKREVSGPGTNILEQIHRIKETRKKIAACCLQM
jgi:hypothetical protein